MNTLHTFGCSITQGFALPDVVKPITNEDGIPYTPEELDDLGINVNWEDIHVYAPSKFAWPQLLADKLGVSVNNYARRGACFNQIARQCAIGVKDIKPNDTVIVMWTYFTRISLQWPARTSVPLCHVIDPSWGLQSVIKGFNKFFGLSSSNYDTVDKDKEITKWIEKSTKETFLHPLGEFDRLYNYIVLQQMTDGFLKATGAKVLHFSVDTVPILDQFKRAEQQLPRSLREYNIPNPRDFYDIEVDYTCCHLLHDPRIPPAENDMHPSMQHHTNFATCLHEEFFKESGST
jgi:hypothetical protein